MNDFERESSTMDMKEEMMSDAVDDAMEGEDEGEGEEVESDKILKEVFDEIGMSMNSAVGFPPVPLIFTHVKRNAEREEQLESAPTANPLGNEPVASSRMAVAEGLPSISGAPTQGSAGGGGGGAMTAEEADLQKRLDALRRD